jgi:hypothetical protein
MKEEWEIWNDVLIHIGNHFEDEIVLRGSSSNYLRFGKNHYKPHGGFYYRSVSKVYFDRYTGIVSYVIFDNGNNNILNKEEFEKEHKEIFREFKLKYLLDDYQSSSSSSS